MKICFAAPRYHTNQHFWVKALQEAGHEVDFLVSYKAEIAEHYEFLSPKVAANSTSIISRVLTNLGAKRLPSRIWLEEYFSTEKPDLVIVRDASNILSLTTFLICKKLQIKTILYSQHPLEDSPKLHVRLLQAVGIVPYRRITPIRKQKYHTELGPAHYVPLITNFEYNIKSRTYKRQPLQVLFIGKFDLTRKNHLLMLEAINSTRKAGYDVHLTMLGWTNRTEPVWHQVQEYLEKHQLHDIVSIKSNVAFADMPTIYKSHDLFVLPSANEPFSITPLEAMSFGVPAIITDQNGVQHCITNNEDGIIIAANDQSALTDILCKLANDRTQLEKLSQYAYATIQDEHTPTTFLTLLNATFNQK